MFDKGSHQDGSGGFRRGDTAMVRSVEEISATLDADAKLQGLLFMPEMVRYCGQSFRVYRRADMTCVEGLGMRSMRNTVFLDGVRCDGSAHGGCQRGCLLFWNEAWLKPAESGQWEEGGRRKAEGGTDVTPSLSNPQSLIPSCSVPPPSFLLPTSKGDRFCCQSTELAGATAEFAQGRLRHYLHDLRMGEITLRRFAYMLWLALANRVWRLLHGRGFCQIAGEQKKTIRAELNLQPGELVEIKSPAEIKATLDTQGRNQGLSFEAEMALHCGRRYRVATPVRTIIAEETGKIVHLSNTVILDGLVCQGICAKNCPRANYFYWREIWLRRV
jgi:hypothetical protein